MDTILLADTLFLRHNIERLK